ncbi:hypothetical protein ONZ45_g508 [Pleurotus djamor]|nr:hypothetical protein ONZ45_g508 [Pleurotus djamor]
MSRHRDIRNLNLQDELDDDALSDGGDFDMTPEEQEQMNDALEQVRHIVGDVYDCGISDADLKNVLWDRYFNVHETVGWVFEEKERRAQARDRKGKDLPPLPSQDVPPTYLHANYQGGERPRIPLIVLAQQQYQENLADDSQSSIYQGGNTGYRLSTISERTERTEPSPAWPLRKQHTSVSSSTPIQAPRPLSATPSTSSYGEIIGDRDISAIDPNLIPLSPSDSAIYRLSKYEPPPSMPSSGTRTLEPTPQQPPSVSLPPLDTIPDIPDVNSVQSKPQPGSSPKKSKLAMLASSRAGKHSAAKSDASSSISTALSGTIRTFPVLRPTSQSIRPPSSVASSVTQSAPKESPLSPDSSIHSSVVDRAIAAAMALGEMDSNAPSSPQQPTEGVADQLPKPTPTPSSPAPPTPLPKSPASTRPPSKLALLAQSKAASSASLPKSAANIPVKLSTKKAIALLPKEHTELLTPTANGPTATTAITTSYQSLFSLTDPSRPRTIPPLKVVPFDAARPVEAGETKSSKITMKIRRAHEKQNAPLSPAQEAVEPAPPAVSPLFKGNTTPQVHKHKERTEGRRRAHKADDKGGDEHREHSRRRAYLSPVPDLAMPFGFTFDGPSPDDIVLKARKAAREREKAAKLASKTATSSAQTSRAVTPINSPMKGPRKGVHTPAKVSGASTPIRGSSEPRLLDLSALNLGPNDDTPTIVEEPPKISFAREKLLEEAKRALETQNQDKKGVSLVVIGHVDAGKSTLMGRLMYDLGKMDEKTRIANERGSSKVGKSSFSWAWGLDGTTEERERGITMDIALQTLVTSHRQITILDAPGHKDFVPNMISGASQADCALLVVDASTGEFEAGFDRGGQTREHLLLVRSLGVSQVVVAVNKLDMVQWDKDRYDTICGFLRPFLVQSGFQPSKTKFAPVGAMQGVNLVSLDGPDAKILKAWYKGPTLVDLLDKLEPPLRDITAPLRIPVSNVFKGTGASTGLSGRIIAGVVQVGERLQILPGDETGIVKQILVEDDSRPWAAAGSNVTLYITAVDPLHLTIGTVLCPPSDPVPLATIFTARIIVFDILVPITAGASIELFHHSRDVPATISRLLATVDRTSGEVIKKNPRVLTKGIPAEVQITLRTTASGPAVTARPIPLETFAVNKDMGRILVRRGGETIAAGIVLEIFG